MVWLVIGAMVAVGLMALLVPLIFSGKRSEFEDFGNDASDRDDGTMGNSFGDTSTPAGKSIPVARADLGDHVRLPPTGSMNDQIYFTIDKKDHYRAEGVDWYEYTGTYHGSMVGIEVYNSDGLEVTLYQDFEKVRLEDVNLTEEQLNDLARSRHYSTSITYQGKQFAFDWCGEIAFHEDNGPDAEQLFCWDFREQRGNRILAVEKYQDAPYVVYLGYFVKPSSVKVHRD